MAVFPPLSHVLSKPIFIPLRISLFVSIVDPDGSVEVEAVNPDAMLSSLTLPTGDDSAATLFHEAASDAKKAFVASLEALKARHP